MAKDYNLQLSSLYFVEQSQSPIGDNNNNNDNNNDSNNDNNNSPKFAVPTKYASMGKIVNLNMNVKAGKLELNDMDKRKLVLPINQHLKMRMSAKSTTIIVDCPVPAIPLESVSKDKWNPVESMDPFVVALKDVRRFICISNFSEVPKKLIKFNNEHNLIVFDDESVDADAASIFFNADQDIQEEGGDNKDKDKDKDNKGKGGLFSRILNSAAKVIKNAIAPTETFDTTTLLGLIKYYNKCVSISTKEKEVILNQLNNVKPPPVTDFESLRDKEALKKLSNDNKNSHVVSFQILMKIDNVLPDGLGESKSMLLESFTKFRYQARAPLVSEEIFKIFLLNNWLKNDPNVADLLLRTSFLYIELFGSEKHIDVMFSAFINYVQTMNMFDLEDLYTTYSTICSNNRVQLLSLFAKQFNLFSPHNELGQYHLVFQKFVEHTNYASEKNKFAPLFKNIDLNALNPLMLGFILQMSQKFQQEDVVQDIYYNLIQYPDEFIKATSKMDAYNIKNLGTKLSSRIRNDFRTTGLTKYIELLHHTQFYSVLDGVACQPNDFTFDTKKELLNMGRDDNNKCITFLQNKIMISASIDEYVTLLLAVPAYRVLQEGNKRFPCTLIYINLMSERELALRATASEMQPWTGDHFQSYWDLCKNMVDTLYIYSHYMPIDVIKYSLPHLMLVNKLITMSLKDFVDTKLLQRIEKYLVLQQPSCDNNVIHWPNEFTMYMENKIKIHDMLINAYKMNCMNLKSDDVQTKALFDEIARLLLRYFDVKLNDHIAMFKEAEEKLNQFNCYISAANVLSRTFSIHCPINESKENRSGLILQRLKEVLPKVRQQIVDSCTKNGLVINNDQSLMFLGHFGRQSHNQFFLAIINFYAKSSSDANKVINVDMLCERTKTLMQDIINMNPDIEVTDLFQEFANFSGISQRNEIITIYKYFNVNDGVAADPNNNNNKQVDAAKNENKIIDFITRITSIYGYKKNLDILFGFLQNHQDIKIHDWEERRDYLNNRINIFMNGDEKGVQDCQVFFKLVSRALGGLDYTQLEYFKDVPVDLLKFYSCFKGDNFIKKCDIITQNLLTDTVNDSLLTKTINVHSILAPLITAYTSGKSYSLEDFCKAVYQRISTTDSQFQVCLDKIKVVTSSFAQVQVLFSTATGTYSLETILPAVVNLLAKSEFVSRTSKFEEGLLDWFIEVKADKTSVVHNQNNIEDFDQGLKFVMNNKQLTKAKQEQMANIENFATLVVLLKRIHNLHCQLDSTFHPRYFKGEIKMDIRQSNIQKFQHMEKQLEAHLREWRESIKMLPPQLWLLRSQALSSMIKEVVVQADLLTIFKEYPQRMFPKDQANYIDFLIQLVAILKERNFMDVYDLNEDMDSMGPMIHTLTDKRTVFDVLTQLNNSKMPDPGQVFYAHTFDSEMEHFFRISKHVKGAVLFLLGIPKRKERLLYKLSKYHQNQRSLTLSRIYIISLERNDGQELFTFIDRYNEKIQINHWGPEIKKQWIASSAIKSLNLLQGPSGTGKTFYVHSLKSTVAASTTVHFRPGFDPKSLIDTFENFKYQQFPAGTNVLVHFLLSPYADMDQFNQFIYPLIMRGFVFGHRVGEIINIPETINLQCFIEIGSPLEECKLSIADYVSQSIPLIQLLAKPIRYENSNWMFTKDCHDTLTKFLPRAVANIDSYIRDDVTSIARSLEPAYRVPSITHHQRTNFLHLLCERLKFHTVYLVFHRYLQQNGHPVNRMLTPDQLYNQFVLESVKLSDPIFASNQMIQERPPLITCPSLPVDEADGFKMAMVDFVDFSNNPHVQHVDTLITQDQAKASPAQFRNAISNAFGIHSRTYILGNLSQQYCFVLTPDFGMRLLLLHNKVKNQRSLVLTGDTGVGKTYVLLFYSLLINAKNDRLPDILFDIKSIINTIIKNHNIRAATIPNIDAGASKQEILDWLLRLDDYNPVIGAVAAQQAAETAKATFKANLYLEIESKIKKLLKDYELINMKGNDILARIRDGAARVVTSKDTMIETVTAIMSVEFHSLFHRVIMHQRFTSKEFKLGVKKLIEQAKDLAKINTELKMVVFIDEFNTAPFDTLSLIEEIFANGRLDGEDCIPSNIFWVGAMNPQMVTKGNSVDYTGQLSATSSKAFVVHNCPPSMARLQLNYGVFEARHEEPFLEHFSKLRPNISQHWDQLKQFIIIGQNAIRDAKEDRVHMSIRDLVRSIDIYRFFMEEPCGERILMCAYPKMDEDLHHWLAMIVSIALSYYLRVSVTKRKDILTKCHDFIARFCPYLFDNLPGGVNVFLYTFKQIYTAFCSKEHTHLPPGIALTEALQLNIFCTVVSVNCMIPLCIVGPPGCSKTLSFSIVSDNMNMPKIDQRSPWAAMRNMVTFRYQCTQHTTDIEIKQKFEQALNRQREYDNSNSKMRSVVFLDEAGLVNEDDSPMKIMHDYLDKVAQKTEKETADIAIVILSNKILDAAKTNRMLLLVHPPTITKEDEVALVQGCLFNNETCLEAEIKQQTFISDALCAAYKRVNEFARDSKANLFHQRDFVYFLRHMSRAYNANNKTLNASIVLHSLERNFGGVPLGRFREMATVFLKELKMASTDDLKLLEHDNTVERIKESLAETVDTKQNLNVAAFRYMMLIDPTENETSLMILRELQVEHTVIRVGGFETDTRPESLVKVVSEIKNAMTVGSTVVLVNTQLIDACFYEVFNRYFTIQPDDDGDKFVAMVSFASHSILTPVHPEFKIIVHMPLSRLENTQLPWLNRFEKYYLSLENMMEYFLRTDAPHLRKDCELLIREGNHFANFFHASANRLLLAGFSDSETVPSLVYSMAREAYTNNTTMSIAPAHVMVKADINEKFESTKERLSLSKMFNWKLLQLARPETMFNLKKMPKSYVEEYLLRQDHFNALRFLHNVIQRRMIVGDTNVSNKWIIYTRSSPSLDLMNDAKVDEVAPLLFSGLDLTTYTRPLTNNILSIIQISSIKSSEQCRSEIVNRFINNDDKQICLIVANMEFVNQHQINYVVNIFNEFSRPDKLVVTICHYSPEFSISNQTKLNSIFLNGFDYLYVDSFGVGVNHIPIESFAKKIDVDIRTWIAKAYGLRPIKADDYSLREAFKTMFLEKLTNISMTSNNIRNFNNHRHLSETTKEFYSNAQFRSLRAKDLFVKHPVWYNEIIQSFERVWDDEHVFPRIIANISNLILTGKTCSSFLQTIKDSMESYLYPTIAQTFRYLFNHLMFEHINRVEVDTAQEQLVTMIIRSIEFNRPVEIENRFEPVKLSVPLAVRGVAGQPKAITLPLFETINTIIQNMLNHVLHTTKSPQIDAITSSMHEHIQRHRARDLITHIDNNYQLRNDYTKDFVVHQLEFEPQWTMFVFNMMQRLTPLELNSIVDLSIIKHFHSPTINFLKHMVEPIYHLDKDTDFLELFIGELNNTPINERVLKTSHIRDVIVRLSMSRLADAFSSDVRMAEFEFLKDWLAVVREVFNRNTIEQIRLRTSDSTVNYVFIVYQILIDNAISHNDELIIMSTARLLREAFPEPLTSNNTHATLTQLHQLNIHLVTSDMPPVPIQCVLDIIEASLYNEHNINVFLRICNKDRTLRSEMPELVDQIPYGWCSNLLHTLLLRQDTTRMVKRGILSILGNGQVDHKRIDNPAVLPMMHSEVMRKSFGAGTNPCAANPPLANVLYHSIMQCNRATGPLDINQLMATRSDNVVNDVYSTMERYVLDTMLLDHLATLINTVKTPAALINHLTTHAQEQKAYRSLLDTTKPSSMTLANNIVINQVYLLNNITSEAVVIDLVKSAPLLKLLGMDELHVAENILVKQMTLMPFIDDTAHPDHKLYIMLKTAVDSSSIDVVNELIRATPSDRDRGFIRMALFLLTYQMYLAATPLNFVDTLFDNNTFSHHFGLANYKHFYTKFTQERFISCTLDNMLRRTANRDLQLEIRAQILVNFIAVAIGCSPNSYLYNVARAPNTVVVKPFPAHEGHAFKDCGMMYRMQHGPVVTGTMGGITMYKFLVNCPSWGVMAYALTCCADNVYQAISNTAFVIRDHTNNTRETLVNYVADRSYTCITEVEGNPMMRDQHMDYSLFFAEFAYVMWSDSYFSPISFQQHTNNIPAYERHLTSLIKSVEYSYRTLQDKRTAMSQQRQTKMHWIRELRNTYTGINNSPAIDPETATSIVSDRQDIPVLKLFNQKIEDIVLSRHIPVMVHFLKTFFHYFSYRLPKDYLNRTVPECLEFITPLESIDATSTIHRAWDALKDSWDKVTKRLTAIVVGCHSTHVGKIDDSTPLTQIIYSTVDEQNIGSIIDLINTWMQNTQQKILDDLNNASEETIFGSIINGYGGEKSMRGTKIDEVPSEYGDNYLLIGANIDTQRFYDFLSGAIAKYHSFTRSEFKPNMKMIESKLICSFLSGKVYRANLERFNMFPIAHAVVAEDNDPQSGMNPNTLMSESIKSLISLNMKLLAPWRKPISKTCHTLLTSHCHSKSSHKEMESLCQYFNMAITHLLRHNHYEEQLDNNITVHEFTQSKRIGHDNLPGDFLSVLESVSLNSIHTVTSLVIKEYLMYSYLYADTIRQPVNPELGSFNLLKDKLLADLNTSPDAWKQYLHTVIHRLNSPDCKEDIKKVQPNEPLRNLLDKYVPSTHEEFKMPPSKTFNTHRDIVEVGLTLNYYPILMRTLHDVLSTVYISSLDAPSAEFKELHGSELEIDDPMDTARPTSSAAEDAEMSARAPDHNDADAIDRAPKSHGLIHPIKPPQGNELATCLFNWLRFLPSPPQYHSNKSFIASLIDHFKKDCIDPDQPINVDMLFTELAKGAEQPNNAAPEYPGCLLMSILDQVTKKDDLFEATIMKECDKCENSWLTQSNIMFRCHSNNQHDDINNTIRDSIKDDASNQCPNCHLPPVQTLERHPQYVFVELDRMNIIDQSTMTVLTLSDYYQSDFIISYQLQSFIFKEDSVQGYTLVVNSNDNQVLLCSSHSIQRVSRDDCPDVFQKAPLLLMYKFDDKVKKRQ
ncbi:hypothetical protein SAMD00019534_098710 [Acytostelium subglobosum LB1]|uniref:hypothetical protein n=1 Tax=Acytostelium subglobosum LB1 TaxID=1410327 RepID=UPI000644A29B|nr:hypothetical protein SAMD00019534_098710 [Acytostelium subglobosum LB1]GAM26696.1 hypothetical protein SAMD00019534_098710 [Acytostelium subglobosum LB1]|eukprot:XP_012750357.1 hypothetical protein SAMD00019534_098710 [Acytostelium subglobosum LB1]